MATLHDLYAVGDKITLRDEGPAVVERKEKWGSVLALVCKPDSGDRVGIVSAAQIAGTSTSSPKRKRKARKKAT